jgi:hypothetical protein
MLKSKKPVHHHRKSYTAKTAVWPYAVIGLSVAFIALAFAPRQIALPGFIALLIIGVIVATVAGIRMAISPFEESASCGLMYTYVPRYWLYYLVTRKRRMLRPFLWHLGGDALAIASFVALSARVATDPAGMIEHTKSHQTATVAQQPLSATMVANSNDAEH